MRTFTLPLILMASFGLSTPVLGRDLSDVIGGIAQSLIQQEVDRNAYVAAQNANTVSAYRDYLAKFENGRYRTNAENALARLGTPVEGSPASAAQAEARLGITFTQRVSVQRELTRMGYKTYGTDGVWGRNTRSAISNWQRDRGDKVTGYVTGEQLRLLARGTVVTPPSEDQSSGDLTPAQAEARLSTTVVQRVSVQRELTRMGYKTYGTDGIWGRNTRSAISNWQRDRGDKVTGYVTGEQLRLLARDTVVTPPSEDQSSGDLTPAQAEARLSTTVVQRVSVQRELTRMGYKTYGTDGIWGRNTRSAISNWQRDRGDKVTGYVTGEQLRLLARGTVVTPPSEDQSSGDLTPAQIEAALRLTRAQRITIQRQLKAVGYDAGVADGLWGSRTRAAISAWQRANQGTPTGYVTETQVRLIANQAGTAAAAPDDSASGPALEESLLGLTRAERVDLQRRLVRLGYKSSPTDGIFSSETRRAVAEWQAREGETATGYLTADQVRLIRVETGG
ncbi:peptidoglycan-binding domain-containing protein [Roseobacter sp. GAI101]|uniref:peptidoglycan-binding domain-containing protein n=1 Tax=Roseobacter sp. (strain GAI101) TaxID=391589 RepID=UPI0002F9BC70|nr:peptidoglycan-binding protein [Roseobacter sp. GAI101]